MANDARTNIFPVLRYKDARGAIAWFERAFGFEKLNEYTAPDGSVAHAELRVGTGVIGLSAVRPPEPANSWTLVRDGVYVVVTDADAHHDRAKAAGAEIVMPLKDQDYGSRDYSARDLDGRLWGFGTYDMSAGAGEQNIFVELHYRDLRRAIAWLNRAFGFESILEVPGADGQIAHAELRFGPGVLMVSPSPAAGSLWGDNTQGTWVYLPDPDAHFARAKAAGADIAQAPMDTPYGSRGYYARDPEGFLWGFSTYRPAAKPSAAAR
jgi:uncharacterized glyoxalase superfamily protein PhnB